MRLPRCKRSRGRVCAPSCISLFLLPVLVFTLPASSGAAVYQYVDEEGTIVVTDRPLDSRTIWPGAKTPRSSPPKRGTATLSEDLHYEYYRLDGGTFPEIMQSIQREGLPDEGSGKRVPARTEWSVGWSYHYRYHYTLDHERHRIRVSLDIYDVELHFDITVVLPTIADPDRLSVHDRAIWEDFLGTLSEHEQDHVTITRDGFPEDAFIRDLTSLKSLAIPYHGEPGIDRIIADAVQEKTASVGTRWVEQIKDLNRLYDEITAHGKKHDRRHLFFAEHFPDGRSGSP